MLDKPLKNSSWTKLNMCSSFSGDIICTCCWCLGTLSSNCQSRDMGSWHNLLCTPKCSQSSTCSCSKRWRMGCFQDHKAAILSPNHSLTTRQSCHSLSLSQKWPKQRDWLLESSMIINMKHSLVHSNLMGCAFSPY